MAELARLDVRRRTVPTDAPESDGTLAWDSTTAVIVELAADGVSGMGWTYADGAAAAVIESKLAPALHGCDLDCVAPAGWRCAGPCATTATPDWPHARNCAPALHAHAACSVQRSARLEYFHDHVRLERRLFEGAPEPDGGKLTVDRTRPGHGLSVRVSRACP